MVAKRFRNFLSEELVERILGRMQCMKTLLRCTAVCKAWRSLIKSSRYIDTHLSSPSNKKYLLCKNACYSLYSDSEQSEKCCELVFPDERGDIDVHGCCNGVICYTYTEIVGNPYVVYLWNPCVRKLKVLPEFRKHGHLNNAIGFWFNTQKKDLEVVRIAYSRETSVVEVYSWSSDSWEMISENCPGAVEIRDENLVYIEGRLHWITKQERGWIVVSLDMNNAKFREKLISGQCAEATKFYLARVHAESNAILRCGWSKNAFGGKLDGCIIEVYDKNLQMISRDSYDVRDKALFLVGFRNNGEALLIQIPSTEDKMVSYDFGTKQFKDFIFSGQLPALARPYVKSLVLLNDSDVQITTTPVAGSEFI